MFKRIVIYSFLLFVLAVTPVLGMAAGPQAPRQAAGGQTMYLPVIERNDSSNNPPPPPVGCGQIGNPLLEGFEGPASGWKVGTSATLGGSVTQSTARAGVGTGSALASTSAISATAQVQAVITDTAASHIWDEPTGTYHWQQACVYLPSSTVSQLSGDQYLTLAGTYPTAGGPYGWYLRVKANGQLYVVGYPAVGIREFQKVEFNVYGTVPTDRWFELEIGLLSQAGPGVKRAFAFLLDGNFYGWYNQGNMSTTEDFNRMAIGILDTSTAAPLQVFVDEWRQPGTGEFPNGPDLRPVTDHQSHDYRNQSGVQWQIDWSTWSNDLILSSQYGLYAGQQRAQSGQNLDRISNLSDGWAQIEMDWPNGTPPSSPNGAFAGMIGFRKNINREENLQVIPEGDGTGNVNLSLEAWVNGGATSITSWPLPAASTNKNSHIPEPGDVLLVRWEQVSPTQIHIQASYYDASAATWNPNVIDQTIDDTNMGGVNFNDGTHNKMEFTLDSVYYSIRKLEVGTLASYPTP